MINFIENQDFVMVFFALISFTNRCGDVEH